MENLMNTSKLEKVATQAAKSIETNGQAFTENFSKEMKAYSRGAVESISNGYETAVGWVKKNPIQAAAIGAGVGIVLGAVVRKIMVDRKTPSDRKNG